MFKFKSSKTKIITWLFQWSLFAILSEAYWFNDVIHICFQNVLITDPSITQTKTQIVDPYPKIRYQKPSKISRNFLPKVKKPLLGLVSCDIFPRDLLRWCRRFFHYHVLNKCCALSPRTRPRTQPRITIIQERPTLLYTSYFVRWIIKRSVSCGWGSRGELVTVWDLWLGRRLAFFLSFWWYS